MKIKIAAIVVTVVITLLVVTSQREESLGIDVVVEEPQPTPKVEKPVQKLRSVSVREIPRQTTKVEMSEDQKMARQRFEKIQKDLEARMEARNRSKSPEQLAMEEKIKTYFRRYRPDHHTDVSDINGNFELIKAPVPPWEMVEYFRENKKISIYGHEPEALKSFPEMQEIERISTSSYHKLDSEDLKNIAEKFPNTKYLRVGVTDDCDLSLLKELPKLRMVFIKGADAEKIKKEIGDSSKLRVVNNETMNR